MGRMSLHPLSARTLVPSWARLLIPLVAVGAACAFVTSAAADTVISPPTISAPLGGHGPYTAGTPVTFTFTEPGLSPPAAYHYTLNGGPAQTVQAPSGTASVQITPAREQSELTVYAGAADGTVGGRACAHSATILITMPETPRPFLLILGDADGLAYVLREHRLAFTRKRRIPLARGDIVFLYTTRRIFRSPSTGRGLIIGRAEIISDIVKFESGLRIADRFYTA